MLDLLRAIADPDDRTARARAFITAVLRPVACRISRPATICRPAIRCCACSTTGSALAEAGDFETLFARIVEDSGVVCRESFLRDSERALTNYLHLLEILQEEVGAPRAHHPRAGATLGAYIAGTRSRPADRATCSASRPTPTRCRS